MTDVKRYRVSTLPGRITRDCPEVVLASDFDALAENISRLDGEAQRWSDRYHEMKAERDALRAEHAAEVERLTDSKESNWLNWWEATQKNGALRAELAEAKAKFKDAEEHHITASLFIREVVEAIGRTMPKEDATVDLVELLAQVVGWVEQCKAAEAERDAALARERGLREALIEARRQLEASGLWFDHPTLKAIDAALAASVASEPLSVQPSAPQAVDVVRYAKSHGLSTEQARALLGASVPATGERSEP